MLMNQKSREQSKNDIKKDFYTLMNNSNFGYNCRNNFDNCRFIPIFDQLKEITYINRYHNIFDPKISEFVTPDLLKTDVEEKFNYKLMKLDEEIHFMKLNYKHLKQKDLQI